MTSLHVLFTLRNQQAFQRLLESSRPSTSATAPSPSTSGGKSWNRPSALTSNAVPLDVNSRDWLGRTVLHLACSASDPAATEYVRLLLAHPAISVNIHDTESHWTALHRALYHGNIASAMLLLQRSDIDPSIKDHEGHIAFDLYNSTVERTAPFQHMEFTMKTGAEIFTWGDNKNAALGSGSGGDRNLPEHVTLRSLNDEDDDKVSRLTPICVRQLAMSKLHTAVVTMEDRNNVRVCGFASGGRLGPVQHLQYDLSPVQLLHRVIRVALGQDHTLALTESGAVYSWGLNRFSQLGYVIDQVTGGELIQPTPKRIYGILRNKDVRGIAACKTASACWTLDEVFTWGTNNGQLGYEKSAQPIQPLPRLVTKITNPVSAIAITDSAMACLLESGEVVCLWNDRHFKINFQLPLFPPDIFVSSPRAALKTEIVKVTSCEETFGSLSSTGELFIFTMAGTDGPGGKDRMVIKPQRVWALRKQSSAVRDFALGSDGSIIMCTESGHVFVRSRSVKGPQAAGKAFKFQRIPYIQRVVGVCANNTGAFGALRVDFVPEPIEVVGNIISQDLAAIQPFMNYRSVPTVITTLPYSPLPFEEERNDEDPAIQSDIKEIFTLCDMLFADRQMRKDINCGLFDGARSSHGPDVMIQVQSGFTIPIHSVVLYARCPVLHSVASGKVKVIQDTNIVIRSSPGKPSKAKSVLAPLTINGCQPLSVLIFLVYLCSDHVLAVWDPRICSVVENQVHSISRGGVERIRMELRVLARILDLTFLIQALEGPTKKTPIPSLVNDFTRVFEESQDISRSLPCKPDVILDLADRQVFCHSVLLRARSPLFAAFFDDEEWTVNRWGVDGTLVVNLKHLKWRVMEFVVQFMCCGADEEMFENITSVNSVDQLLDFMFDLMAAASELLIDRLVLMCSAVILRHININNVCSVFADATFYNATSLKEKVQIYMAVNMETLLESHMLDDLSPDLIRQLSSAVRKEQAAKSSYIRSTKRIDELMKRHEVWLSLQDIPQTIVRSTQHISSFKDSVRGSPNRKRHFNVDSPAGSLAVEPLSMKPGVSSGQDDIFAMDEEVMQSPSAQERQPSPKPSFGWKALGSAHRTDMKTIMAEAENQKAVARTPPSTGLGTSSSPRWSPSRTPQRTASETLISRTLSGSAWKTSAGHASTSPLDLSTPLVSQPTASSPSGLAQSRPGTSVAGGPDSRLPSSSVVTPSKQASSPARPQTKPAQPPGLGPMFTPSRHQPQKSGSVVPRSVSGGSSGNPWTAPVIKLPTSPIPGATTSFAAIQLMQQEEYFTPARSKQSLKEIQEEEQARRAEQEFLRWWTAEEERLKIENELVAGAVVGSRKRGSKKFNKKKASGENLQQRNGDSGKKVKTRASKGTVIS